MNTDIQDWLRYAESDLVSAEGLHRIGQDLHSVFFLQQSVEKTLKALLTKRTGSEPPRIHNLHKLADLCALPTSREQLRLLEILNGYYTESRYPGEMGGQLAPLTAAEAEAYLAQTREMIAWLRQRL
jgi:HEPN domain-containing protein